MSELAHGNIGSVGEYEIKFEGGKLILVSGVNASPLAASINLSVDALAIKDAIKKAIPGQVDDVVLDLVFNLLVK